MLFDDEDRKPARKAKDLAPMSVAELKDYIESLKQEIQRAEEEIARKERQKSAAASIFKD